MKFYCPPVLADSTQCIHLGRDVRRHYLYLSTFSVFWQLAVCRMSIVLSEIVCKTLIFWQVNVHLLQCDCLASIIIFLYMINNVLHVNLQFMAQ